MSRRTPTPAAFAPAVACVGLLVADTVGTPIDALPRRGTLEIIDRIELHTGGNGANTSASLAKLACPSRCSARFGQDNFGDFMSVRSRRAASTWPACAAMRPPELRPRWLSSLDAERTFLHVPGANATLTESDISWDAITDARIFHIAGLQLLSALEGEPLARVLAEAKRRGMITTLDTVMNPRSLGWAGLAPALPHLDWAVPSFEEAAQLTGETKALRQARKLQEAGARNVAIKMGAHGCLVVPENDKPFHVAALPNVQAIDALGAGDAWACRLARRPAARLALGKDRPFRQRRGRLLRRISRRDNRRALARRNPGPHGSGYGAIGWAGRQQRCLRILMVLC
jgi:sugar/nucleoside kinase (ribokinase family)